MGWCKRVMKEYRRAGTFHRCFPTSTYITRWTGGLNDGSSERVRERLITFVTPTTFLPASNIAVQPKGSSVNWKRGWHSFIWNWNQPRRDWWSSDGSLKNEPGSEDRSRGRLTFLASPTTAAIRLKATSK